MTLSLARLPREPYGARCNSHSKHMFATMVSDPTCRTGFGVVGAHLPARTNQNEQNNQMGRAKLSRR